jgi:hypothetical protein
MLNTVFIRITGTTVPSDRKNRLTPASFVLLRAGVTTKTPGGRKLSQSVAYHILGYIYGNELFAIVYGKRVPDKFGSNHGCPAPGLDDFLLPGRIQFVHLSLEFEMNKRAFF